VFFWVSTPADSTIDISLLGGFSNIIIRKVTVPVSCPNVRCDPTTVPTQLLTLEGGAVATWTYVTISAVNPAPGDLTLIDFTLR